MRVSALIAVIFSLVIYSCDVIGPCEQMNSRKAIFLLDVTDSLLYESIEKDIKGNFSSFMKRSQLASISECERFTFGVGHLSGLESLELSDATIELTSKGESLNKQRELSNPAEIGVLMKQKLEEYRELTAHEDYTSGSFLVNQILRAVNESPIEEETMVVVFSDLIENNKHLNMYKNQFDFASNPEIIRSLIEPSVLDKFQSDQQAGKSIKIVLVQKDEPNGKVDKRKLKVFWSELFEYLRVDHQFVDNLSQNISL